MADRTGKKYTCKMPAADQDAAKNGSTAGKEVMRCPTLNVLMLCTWQIGEDMQAQSMSWLLQEAHLKETKQQSTPSELLDDLSESCRSVMSGSVLAFATIRSGADICFICSGAVFLPGRGLVDV